IFSDEKERCHGPHAFGLVWPGRQSGLSGWLRDELGLPGHESLAWLLGLRGSGHAHAAVQHGCLPGWPAAAADGAGRAGPITGGAVSGPRLFTSPYWAFLRP